MVQTTLIIHNKKERKKEDKKNEFITADECRIRDPAPQSCTTVCDNQKVRYIC